MLFFFFFQAEDGIRDYKVTGVQTCALPILSPAGASINAAFPPGLGLELSLPRQLSSAWTRTRGPPVGAPATSGLDDHRNIGVPQDLLRVGHDHGAGPALAVAHVRPGEQCIAADPLEIGR